MSTLVRPAAPTKGQRRTLATPANFEVRELGKGRVGIRGYAAVYDQVAYDEVVRKGAFDKTVAERDDVRFLTNHGGVPWARTKSGTGVLSLDDKGLIAEAPDLDADNPTVRELVSAMQREDIDQMSFAFELMRWSEYVDPDSERSIFELLEVRLWDVSVVTYPWYDETSVDLDLDRALRSLHDGLPLTDAQRQLVAERAGVTIKPAPPAEPEPATVRARPTPADIDRLFL